MTCKIYAENTMNRTRELRRRFRENGNKNIAYTYCQKETVEILGHMTRKDGLENLIFTGEILYSEEQRKSAQSLSNELQ